MVRPARRSLVVFSLLAGGIVLARALPESPAPAWFSIACLGCAIAAIFRGWTCRIALSIACIAFAGGWWTLQVPLRGGSTLDQMLESARPSHAERIVEVEGIATETPRTVERGGALARFVPMEPRESFELRVLRVRTDAGWRESSGRLRVFGGEFETRAGDSVRVMGLHSPTRRAMNAGDADRISWAAMRRDAGTLSVSSSELVRPQSTAPSLGRVWLSGRAWLRDRARAVLDGPDGDGGTLLRAVTLGVHDPDRGHVRDAFTRVGLAHLMAISGFHLALLVGLVLLAMRLSADWGRLEAIVIVALVLGYLIITPARPPIVRAGLVVLAIVVSESRGRRYDRLSVLGWVGVALLLFRPMDLFTLGFQLSLGLTGALLWLAGRVDRRLGPTRIRGLIERPDQRLWPAIVRGGLAKVRSAFVVTLVCWLVAVPIVIYHTGLVSPMAIATTLLVTPVIVLILALGFAGVVVGLVLPTLGGLIASLGATVGDGLVWSVEIVDTLPLSSIRLPTISLAWAIVGVLIAIAWLRLGGTRRRTLAACTIGVLVWLGAEVGSARLDRGVRLRVDALSVGDGTCYLLRSGGEAMLWDCGSSRVAFGERELGRIVRELGAWHVRTVVITHPNLDHYNALIDAIEPLGVRRVIVGDAFLDRATRRNAGGEAFVLTELAREGVMVRTIRAGQTLELGEVTLELISPDSGWSPSNVNSSSLVARVRAPTARGERRVLLTGDIEREAMVRLLELGEDLRANALELPHHGSHHPTGEAFLERVDPAIVVQSTGPSRLLDERWERARQGRRWLVTARDGAIALVIHTDGRIETSTFIPR